MSSIITFTNHSPLRVADADLVQTIWRLPRSFGHHDLERYTTQRGKSLYWISYNSGEFYNGRDPRTTRTYLPTVDAIRRYFEDHDLTARYHAEVEALVDPASILDVDTLP